MARLGKPECAGVTAPTLCSKAREIWSFVICLRVP